MAASTGWPGCCSSRVMTSASTMTAPRSARAATLWTSEPMPPVSPTRITGKDVRLAGQARRPRAASAVVASAHPAASGGSLGSAQPSPLADGASVIRARPDGSPPGRIALATLAPCQAPRSTRPRPLPLGVVRDGVVALLVDAEVLAVLLGQLATLGGLLDRQADAAAGEVEVDDLDPQLLAGGDDLLGRLDVVGRHLRDVHQALDAVAHLDERTERARAW